MDLKYMKQSNWAPFSRVASRILPSTVEMFGIFEFEGHPQRTNVYKCSSKDFLVTESRNLLRELNHDECNLRFNKRAVLAKIQLPGSLCWTGSSSLETTPVNRSGRVPDGGVILEVIELIRIKLKGNPCFSVHDILTNKRTSFQSKDLELESEVHFGESLHQFELAVPKIQEGQLPAYSEKDLIEIATSDPQTSYELQLAIQMSGKGIEHIVQNVTRELIQQLIEHKHGSYVLQQMVKLSEEVRSLVISHCMAKFEMFYGDPFASRVMQLLSVYSKEFRLFLFNWLKCNLKTAMSSPPAVFLLTSCMGKISSAEELEVAGALFLTEKISSDHFFSRHFKRLLVSFLHSSPLRTVEEFVALNQLDKCFKNLLNDKFGALILFVTVKKGELKARKKLQQLLSTDLHGLFRTKFFKLFFYKTAKYAKEDDKSLHYLLSTSLRRVTPQSFLKVVSKEDSKLFFVFLLLVAFPPTESNLLMFASEVKGYLTHGSGMIIPLRLFSTLDITIRSITV